MIRQPTLQNTEIVAAELPPPINHNGCKKCEYKTICCAYLKHENIDLSYYKQLIGIKNETLKHLDDSHVEYFIHWSSLISLESNTKQKKLIQDIYTKPPSFREKNGKCITNVIVITVKERNGLYTTIFQVTNPTNALVSGLQIQNYVVISSTERPALAAGLISHMDPKLITVELDR